MFYRHKLEALIYNYGPCKWTVAPVMMLMIWFLCPFLVTQA